MSALITEKPVVAAFDFDGTLTRRDTLLPFLWHALGTAAVARNFMMLSPMLAGYSLGLIRNDVAKERVFIRCLGGMEIDALRRKGERFADQVVPGLVRQDAMQRLAWHKKQGHRCVVISASLELYVRPWALEVGFDEIISTRMETLGNGRVSGRLSGANCYGMEKVSRLQALLGGREGYTLYAYGNSHGDKELLSFADHAYYRLFPVSGGNE